MKKHEAPGITPDRPSHFHEDQSQRAPYENTQVEYPNADAPAQKLGWDAPPPPAVPVYQVEPPPRDRTIRRWATATIGLPNTESRHVVNADRKRLRLRIRNNDAANSVALVRQSTDSATNGYILAAGQSEEMFHNDEMWVIALTAPGSVSVFTENEIEDDGQ